MNQQTTSIKNPSFLIKTQFVHLDDEELSHSIRAAVTREKTATLEVLEHLLEIERRKLYANKAYSSLFEYAVKELAYSEPQASERINAMRLLREIPEVKEKIEKGELSITTASQVERFIKNEKKFSGNSLSSEQKKQILDMCSNQSKRGVEKILFSLQSEEAKVQSFERVRYVNEKHVELKFLAPEGLLEKIQLVKDLEGDLTLAQMFSQALDSYLIDLKKKHHREVVKETQKPTETVARPAKSNESERENFAAKMSRYIPTEIKKLIYTRSRGQCEYVDPKSGNRCLSRYRLQFDHVIPMALGGVTSFENLRHLCANHNQRSAIEWFS